MLKWYKHIGRDNSSNIPNFNSTELRKFLIILKANLNALDDKEWEECCHVMKPKKYTCDMIKKEIKFITANSIYGCSGR